jgi:hypothetical protein
VIGGAGTRSLHYDRQPASPTAGARRLSYVAGDLRLASDEGGESGGRPVRVQSNMADTLVERITGQTSALDVSAEVQIMMPLDTLLDANNHSPAELDGYGPLPADVARDIVATSKGRLWWRRLYAAPEGGPLAGGDPFRRRFDGFLRKLIMLRDRRCRDPFCDAPIRHIDHIQRYSTTV